MSHKSLERLFPLNKGSVKTDGYSNQLGKGVLGIVDKNQENTKDGIPIVNAFDGLGKYEIRLGTASKNSRSKSNKAWSSVEFKTKDIVDIKVSAPSLKNSVDEVWLGYDGHNADSAIVLEKGETAIINLILKGDGLGLLGYPNGKADLVFHITAPNTEDFTMQEVVEKAVRQIKETKLFGDVPLTDYVDVKVINSEATSLVGTNYNIYELVAPIEGTSNNVALVQNQYPDLNIKFDSEIAGKSKFIAYGAALPEAFVVNDVNIVTNCDEYESSTLVPTSYTWTDTGEVCTAVEQNYSIVLPDDNCGQSRLTELQEAYPELTIAAGTSNLCQTEYTTTVLSNFSCEGCSENVQDLLAGNAPEPYDMVAWELDTTGYSATALMGVAFKGKETVIGGGEEYRDTLPYIYSFVELSVNGGYPFNQALNYYEVDGKPQYEKYFKTTWISRGAKPEALGMNFLKDEEQSRVYYTLDARKENDLFANAMLGQESLIEPFSQYVMYSIHVRRKTLSQSFTQELNEHIRYNIIAEVGRHKDLEALVNTLATAANLPTVEAYTEA